jgi:hypothetical protein
MCEDTYTAAVYVLPRRQQRVHCCRQQRVCAAVLSEWRLLPEWCALLYMCPHDAVSACRRRTFCTSTACKMSTSKASKLSTCCVCVHWCCFGVCCVRAHVSCSARQQRQQLPREGRLMGKLMRKLMPSSLRHLSATGRLRPHTLVA